jgi:2-polyprenyl-3-methyl-5-hydroxy-6-metoxy-1,4-benzoquinol methylase
MRSLTMIDNSKNEICQHNSSVWDQEALEQKPWSQPVSQETVASAIQGDWAIHITKKPIPRDWLPQDIKGYDILCLASAGGQQAPILAAAGANVTVYDISEKQLEQDQYVANRDNLTLTTIQGDMADLSELSDATFDYIINPISNLYTPDTRPVWHECYRVLRDNGVLLASFYNPILFMLDKDAGLESQGLLKPKYTIPYSDIESLSPEQYQEKIKKGEAIMFGHSLTEQVNGQLEAGFKLTGFYEDDHPSPRFLIEQYMQTMIATKAVKFKDTHSG